MRVAFCMLAGWLGGCLGGWRVVQPQSSAIEAFYVTAQSCAYVSLIIYWQKSLKDISA